MEEKQQVEEQVKLLDARLKDLTFRHNYLADSIAQRAALRGHFLAGCLEGLAIGCLIYALIKYFQRGE